MLGIIVDIRPEGRFVVHRPGGTVQSPKGTIHRTACGLAWRGPFAEGTEVPLAVLNPSTTRPCHECWSGAEANLADTPWDTLSASSR